MGYSAVTMTVIALYLGASDTLTNQMRWLTLVLAERPELQEELYNEIMKAEEVDGQATMQNCHLLQSVLLENFRCYPVADTLPHQATEDVLLDGFHVPKGAIIQAWLTGIMVPFFQEFDHQQCFRMTPETFKTPRLSTQEDLYKTESLSKMFEYARFQLGCETVSENSSHGRSTSNSLQKSLKNSS